MCGNQSFGIKGWAVLVFCRCEIALLQSHTYNGWIYWARLGGRWNLFFFCDVGKAVCKWNCIWTEYYLLAQWTSTYHTSWLWYHSSVCSIANHTQMTQPAINVRGRMLLPLWVEKWNIVRRLMEPAINQYKFSSFLTLHKYIRQT